MLLLIYYTIAISGIISFNFTQFGSNNTPTSTNISRYLYSIAENASFSEENKD